MGHISKQAFHDIIAIFRNIYQELVQMRSDWKSSSAYENISINREITNGEIPTDAKDAFKKM
eukprot:2183952-Karenia_brevis.AAC.1